MKKLLLVLVLIAAPAVAEISNKQRLESVGYKQVNEKWPNIYSRNNTLFYLDVNGNVQPITRDSSKRIYFGNRPYFSQQVHDEVTAMYDFYKKDKPKAAVAASTLAPETEHSGGDTSIARPKAGKESTRVFVNEKNYDIQMVSYKGRGENLHYAKDLDFTKCEFSDKKPFKVLPHTGDPILDADTRRIYEGTDQKAVGDCTDMLMDHYKLPLATQYVDDFAVIGEKNGKVSKVLPGLHCQKVEVKVAVRESVWKDPNFTGVGFEVFDPGARFGEMENTGLFYRKDDPRLLAAEQEPSRLRFSKDPVRVFKFLAAGPCSMAYPGGSSMKMRPYVSFADGTSHAEDFMKHMPGRSTGTYADYLNVHHDENYYGMEGMLLKPYSEN